MGICQRRTSQKKLIEAAEHWAKGGADDGLALQDDAELLGIELPDAEPLDPLFSVEPDNWQAVMLFCDCVTQWKRGAMGKFLGLDYPGVNVVIGYQIKRKQHAETFASIQLMERAALPILNSKNRQQ